MKQFLFYLSCIWYCTIIQATPLFTYDRAITAGNKGDWQKAEKFVASALIDSPDSADRFYDAGVIAYKNNDIDHAVAYFERAVKFSKSSLLHEQALFNLGNAYVKQGKLQEAIEQYEEILRSNPDNEKAKKNLEIVKKMLKDKEQEKQSEEQKDKNNQKDQNQDNNKKDSQDQGQNDRSDDRNKQSDDSSEEKDTNQQSKSNSSNKEDKSGQDKDGQDKDNGESERQSKEQHRNSPEQSNTNNNNEPKQNKNDQQQGNGDDDKQQDSDDEKRSGSEQNDEQEQRAQEKIGGTQNKSNKAEEDEKAGGAAAEQGIENQKNDNLKNLDAALAQIVEQQGEQDAQLNKQLIKLMIDSQQQPRRNKNDNTPRW